MKTRYSSEELSAIVMKIINTEYGTADKIKTKLNSIINSKVIAFHKPRVLTDTEIETYAKAVAQGAHENTHRIPLEAIEFHLSDELKNTSRIDGIEIAKYKDYLYKVAFNLVKELIAQRYKGAKAELAKLKKRK